MRHQVKIKDWAREVGREFARRHLGPDAPLCFIHEMSGMFIEDRHFEQKLKGLKKHLGRLFISPMPDMERYSAGVLLSGDDWDRFAFFVSLDALVEKLSQIQELSIAEFWTFQWADGIAYYKRERWEKELRERFGGEHHA